MAFTFRASANYDSDNSNTATVNKPAGTVDGDIMFALMTNLNFDTTTAVPSGWTLDATVSNYGGYRLYHKVASSEGADYTWTWGGAGQVRVTIATYYGDYNTSDPIDVVSNSLYDTSNTTVRAASMNVPTANSPLLFFGLAYRINTTITYAKPSAPTTDWVEDVDDGSINSDLYHTFCHMLWTSSGDTGDMDATASEVPSGKHAFAVGIRTTLDYTATQTDTITLTENNLPSAGYSSTNTDTISLTENNTPSKNIFSNLDKNSATTENLTKNSVSATNQTKNSAVITNQTKS